jgi:hypothetical protein
MGVRTNRQNGPGCGGNLRSGCAAADLPGTPRLVRLFSVTPYPVRLLSVAALLLCVSLSARGQAPGIIRGRVVDAETGKPLEFVNVFLANTTLGTATAVDGIYKLIGIPPGSYQLVASRVGYQVAPVPVRIHKGDTLRRDFALVPRIVRAAEVEVVAGDRSQWRRDLAEFSGQFLGEDPFAESCRIVNPEVLGFRHDSATGTLITSTDSVICVNNSALGYRLFVNLQNFSWQPEKRTVAVRMYLRFEPMRPGGEKDSATWSANRREAFRGSLRHFLRSLVQGQLEAEAFLLSDERGKAFGPAGQGVVFDAPSGYKMLASERVLCIEYRGSNRVRKNYVRFAAGIVHVHPDGFLLENQEFLIDPASDWAQERLSRLVPLDYVPHESRTPMEP